MPHLSEIDKAKVVAHLENGRTIVDVAAEFGVVKSSISRIKRRWENEQTLKRKAGSGRPRATTAQEDEEMINFLRENPLSSAVEAIEHTNFPATKSTACRRIKNSELQCYYAARKPFLTNFHKEERVGFALQFLNREDIWNRVIFSDEKTFKSYYDGRMRVYRPRNTRFEERYIQQRNICGHFSVNVWACISGLGPGSLCTVEGRLNAETYINILNDVMLPSATQRYPENNYIFQQDNCPIHTAALTQEWLTRNNINVLPGLPEAQT